jgi:hypothetical protein
MRDRPNPDRRSVLAAAALLAGAATAPTAWAGPATLTLFDPDEPAARVFAASQGGRSIPIEGDRIRLARRLFAEGAPDRVTVVARHADVLLLADAAREEGYRGVAVDPFPAMDGRSGFFVWAAKRPPLGRSG